MSISQQFVREQGTQSVPEYRKRVYRLAAVYLGIVATALASIILIIWHGKFFVTLSQRSNVETLTLAFIIVLFAYLTVVSAPGAWGAAKLVAFNLPAWVGGDRDAVERRKQRALKPKEGDPSAVFLNCLVGLAGQPDEPVRIPLRDATGSLGTLVVDGPHMYHEEAVQSGSNSIFAYFEQRMQQLVRQRDPDARVQIVQWATIDDEQAHQYESMVTFSRNLARHLGTGPLWPHVELTPDDIETLKDEGSELCPILRSEALLPDLEYEAEHRLPIIPEPLGFIALSRQERRADPVAAMGCALIIAVVILALLLVLIVFPPWVPSV